MEQSALFLCNKCNKKFQNSAALLSHTKWTHERKSEYKCEQCEKLFPRKYSLNRHIQTIHGNSPKSAENVKCYVCDFCAKSKKLVFAHYQNVHNIAFTNNTVCFETFEEFTSWKRDFENKTKSQFVKRLASRKIKSGSEISTYICHRNGNFVPRGNNIRHVKVQGSNKIKSYCPAKITVQKCNERVTVDYIDQHIGHELELGRMSISESERKLIAEKLALKIPFQDILDSIRDSVANEQLNRIHLLNRKDLWKIVDSFNINQEGVLHKNGSVSVDAWVSHMQSSSNTIRLYKPQGEDLEGYPQLKKQDFFLVIMNDAQKDILQKFGDDCICIDGTHGLNAYDFQLYTLMVLDDLRQGFPCAFLFSNRGDTLAMELFFKILKQSLEHPPTPKTFMSDMDDSFYNAWCATMSPAKYRLYCSWHVDRAWRSGLNKIKGKDEQAMVYKKLKVLMFETDQNTFTILSSNLFKELNTDPHTKEFAKYFEKYIHNPTTWEYCYRIEYGINTNMHLENMHKILKHIYFDGKKVKRMDKAIHMIMKFIRDKLFDRLIALNKGKLLIKLTELRARHKKALTLTEFCVIEAENMWTVQSTQNTDIYNIQKNNVECKCQLRCLDCDACIHAYHCTCIDSCIKWNMCKHVHLVCMFLKNKMPEVLNTVSDLHGNVEVTVAQETQLIVKELTIKSEDCFEKRKQDALDNILWVHGMIENEEQLQAFMKQTAPLESVVKALSKSDISLPQVSYSEPPNKKIRLQDRFFTTKKKPKAKCGILKKPNTEKETLSLQMLWNN